MQVQNEIVAREGTVLSIENTDISFSGIFTDKKDRGRLKVRATYNEHRGKLLGEQNSFEVNNKQYKVIKLVKGRKKYYFFGQFISGKIVLEELDL